MSDPPKTLRFVSRVHCCKTPDSILQRLQLIYMSAESARNLCCSQAIIWILKTSASLHHIKLVIPSASPSTPISSMRVHAHARQQLARQQRQPQPHNRSRPWESRGQHRRLHRHHREQEPLPRPLLPQVGTSHSWAQACAHNDSATLCTATLPTLGKPACSQQY